MTIRPNGVRALVSTGFALGWAAACGSADTAAVVTHKSCLIYFGHREIPQPPDGANNCPPGDCNYQTQEGCTAAQACFPHYDMASGTISPTCGAAGTQKVGQVCNDTADHICERGLICVDGACAKTCCNADWSACGEGQSCFRTASKFKVPTTGAIIDYDPKLGTCAPVGNCDVLDPNACSGDTKRPVCRIVDPTGAVACAPNGTRSLGDPCDEANQCGKGQHCAGNSSDGGKPDTFCVRFCRFGTCNAEPSCPESEGVCVHFDTDPDGVGECTPHWKGPGLEIDGGALSGGTQRDASTSDH